MSFKSARLGLLGLTASMLIAPGAWALSSYDENFEGLNQADGAALANAGWLAFGNVFDSGGGYLYGYGVFGAPNGTPGFSSVAAGEGGPDQGGQQLVVYSDYNNGDHGNGNLVEANVFQEQFVDAGDVGSTWTFQFDAKGGDLVAPSSSVAFIKTLDPNAGFATTNFITFDTTDLADTWNTFSLSIMIDASLTGQILQFGFAATATNFNASGNFYDNVSFTAVPVPGAVVLMLSALGLLGARRRSA